MAQEETNPDVNERGKLLWEDGKASHEIPAPSSHSEQPTTIQLSEQAGQYSFSRSVHLFWMMRKCLPVFLRRGALPGTAQDLEDTSLQYDFEGDRRTLLLYSKEDTDQDLFTIFSPFLPSTFLEILLLKALQASSEFRYAQTWAKGFMCH